MIFSPTRAKIQALTRYFLEDANVGRTWKNWQLNVAINNAIEFLQFNIVKLDKGWFERTTSFGLTAGEALYTLPSDVAKIKKVEYTRDGGSTWVQLPRAWATQLLRSSSTGATPQCYFFLGQRQIGIYPVPETTTAYTAADSGPIRITYIEKLPRFVELDHPTTFATNSAADAVLNAYETFDIAHQAMQGPAVSFELEHMAADTSYIPIRFFKIIAQFVKRDKNKSRYSPPENIGMPWVSGYTTLEEDPAVSSCKLHITKWPLGDPDNSEWPDDATHLDLWLYVSGNTDHVVLSQVASGNYHDIAFLGNILPDEDYVDGDLIFTHLGGAQTSPSPGVEGRGIWDGRYVTTLDPDGTGVDVHGGFEDSDYTSRWIHQIPPTPYLYTYIWSPYSTTNIYVDNPNSGTARYFDTNPARGDGDIISEDITDDHAEIIAVRSALNILARHGLYNQVLMAHYKELFENFKEFFASRDSAARLVNITNPDVYQVSKNIPPKFDLRR